jgi:hypothetical protein
MYFGQGLSEFKHTGLPEPSPQSRKSIEGRKLDPLLDRFHTQLGVNPLHSLRKVEHGEFDPELAARKFMQPRRSRPDLLTFHDDRPQAIVILVHQRVEEIEGDPTNQVGPPSRA